VGVGRLGAWRAACGVRRAGARLPGAARSPAAAHVLCTQRLQNCPPRGGSCGRGAAAPLLLALLRAPCKRGCGGREAGAGAGTAAHEALVGGGAASGAAAGEPTCRWRRRFRRRGRAWRGAPPRCTPHRGCHHCRRRRRHWRLSPAGRPRTPNPTRRQPGEPPSRPPRSRRGAFAAFRGLRRHIEPQLRRERRPPWGDAIWDPPATFAPDPHLTRPARALRPLQCPGGPRRRVSAAWDPLGRARTAAEAAARRGGRARRARAPLRLEYSCLGPASLRGRPTPVTPLAPPTTPGAGARRRGRRDLPRPRALGRARRRLCPRVGRHRRPAAAAVAAAAAAAVGAAVRPLPRPGARAARALPGGGRAAEWGESLRGGGCQGGKGAQHG
jgi:hypothetical protein